MCVCVCAYACVRVCVCFFVSLAALCSRVPPHSVWGVPPQRPLSGTDLSVCLVVARYAESHACLVRVATAGEGFPGGVHASLRALTPNPAVGRVAVMASSSERGAKSQVKCKRMPWPLLHTWARASAPEFRVAGRHEKLEDEGYKLTYRPS